MQAITWARWGTLAVWVAVAASAAFWGLRLFAPGTPVPAHADRLGAAMALRGDPVRLLGGADAAPAPAGPVVVAEASRFQLVGVVAPRAPKAAAEGVALIAVDGKPARAYRVGASVDGDLVLQRVRARGADLGARDAPAPSVALDLPALPPPATGTLPVAGAPPAPRPFGLPGVPGAVGAMGQPAFPGQAPGGSAALPVLLPRPVPSEQDDAPVQGEPDAPPQTLDAQGRPVQ